MRLAVLTFLTFALAASAGACFPWHSGTAANGANGNLQFQIDGDTFQPDAQALGVELPIDVSVSRLEGQWSLCVVQKNVGAPGAVHAEDVPPCDSHSQVGVALIDAGCDDGSCDVTADAAESASLGTVVLRVVGHKPTSTRLHVSVKSTSDGASWADSWPVVFLPVTRLILAEIDSTHPSTYAMLKGAALTVRGVPENVAGDGTVTALAMKNALTMTSSGGVFTSQPYDDGLLLTSTQAGTGTLDLKGAGLDTEVALRVVDESQVASVVFVAVAPPGSGAIDGPVVASETPLTALTVTNAGATVGVLLTLEDGTKALGGAGLATLSPTAIADVAVSGGAAGELPAASPFIGLALPLTEGPAAGTLTVNVNGASASLQVTDDFGYGSDAGVTAEAGEDAEGGAEGGADAALDVKGE